MKATGLALAATRRVVLAAALLVLAGCESDGASHLINGNTQALSLMRDKPYFWSAWQLYLVVRNDPVCQRRHRMKDTTGSTTVELYSPAPGAYILRQGKRWYVAELRTCGFEQFKEEPAQPGELLGKFLTRDGQYVFEAARADTGSKANAKPADGG